MKKILLPLLVIGLLILGLGSELAFGKLIPAPVPTVLLDAQTALAAAPVDVAAPPETSSPLPLDAMTVAIGAAITLLINVVSRLWRTGSGQQADTKDKILNGAEAMTRAFLPGLVSMIFPNRKKKG